MVLHSEDSRVYVTGAIVHGEQRYGDFMLGRLSNPSSKPCYNEPRNAQLSRSLLSFEHQQAILFPKVNPACALICILVLHPSRFLTDVPSQPLMLHRGEAIP